VRHRAYEDAALPIGVGQTISQPFTQARYLEALGSRGTSASSRSARVRYQTALLAALAEQVFTIERVRSLAETAQAALRVAGVSNVSVLVGDARWVERLCALPRDPRRGRGPEVPPPLVEQLSPPAA